MLVAEPAGQVGDLAAGVVDPVPGRLEPGHCVLGERDHRGRLARGEQGVERAQGRVDPVGVIGGVAVVDEAANGDRPGELLAERGDVDRPGGRGRLRAQAKEGARVARRQVEDEVDEPLRRGGPEIGPELVRPLVGLLRRASLAQPRQPDGDGVLAHVGVGGGRAVAFGCQVVARCIEPDGVRPRPVDFRLRRVRRDRQVSHAALGRVAQRAIERRLARELEQGVVCERGRPFGHGWSGYQRGAGSWPCRPPVRPE
ncbi:MAG TPA: hypothetical protein VE777_21145 [Gaiellales bacterium]|nr:hypothetical protein [Gaiellales bacterium]